MDDTKIIRQQVRQVVEDWAQAIRDIDRVGIQANHTKDLVMFDVAPPLQIKGMDAYNKAWDLFFKYSQGGKGSFDLVELEIKASDTVAFCHALLIIDGKAPQCRLTLGLQKINDQWLITHEHHSAPTKTA